MHGQQLAEAIELFVEKYSTELNLQQTTVKNKRNAMKRLQSFHGNRSFSLETAREFIADLQKKGWTPSSIRAEIKVLRAFCAFCVDRGLISENFCKKITIPKIHKKVRQFVSEEVAEQIIITGTEKTRFDNLLAQFAKDEMRIALRFMLRTGIRISELKKMRGKDLNLDDEQPNFVVHSKGGNAEVLPQPYDMIEELRPRVKQEKVFTVSESGCNRVLGRGARNLKVNKITCHSLRHIFSLSRLRKREPLQLVSRALRHSSVSITDSYYSEFMLNDLVPVVNNSDVILNTVPLQELFNRAERAVNSSGVNRDNRITVEIKRNADELVVKIRKKT